MATRIQELLKQIQDLEDEVAEKLRERAKTAHYHLKDKRIEFEETIVKRHRKLKKSLIRTLVIDRPLNILTSPIIYGMAIPLVLFDLLISFYQLTCFPIYGIRRVKRRHYFIYDRNQLQYLNFIQRVNCQYCAYGNGLMGYAAEIIARTEQYFCPIKHAKKRIAAHPRYLSFSEFGDAEQFEQDFKRLRKQLRQDEERQESEESSITKN